MTNCTTHSYLSVDFIKFYSWSSTVKFTDSQYVSYSWVELLFFLIGQPSLNWPSKMVNFELKHLANIFNYLRFFMSTQINVICIEFFATYFYFWLIFFLCDLLQWVELLNSGIRLYISPKSFISFRNTIFIKIEKEKNIKFPMKSNSTAIQIWENPNVSTIWVLNLHSSDRDGWSHQN